MRRSLWTVAGVIVAFALSRWTAPWPETLPPVSTAAKASQATSGMPDDALGPSDITRIVGGETVDVDCGQLGRDRIRLLNIDTPERGEPGYHEAAYALGQVTLQKEVYLAFEVPGSRRGAATTACLRTYTWTG